jgi:endonuclease/exonuclease/phosphatase family metal-dependent hydrolase
MQEGRQPGQYYDRPVGGTFWMFWPLLLRGHRRWSVLFFSLFPCIATAGCAAGYALERRGTLSLEPGAASVCWFTPSDPKDATLLARWRSSTGPPIVRQPPRDWTRPIDDLTVVSWNTALGAADIPRFVATLPSARPLVLLLQEVYRGGPEVPSLLPPGARFARRHGGAAAGAAYDDIEVVAASLGLALYYVPSMRNGSPAASSEDRGNAILSTLPLNDLVAIELPFERQRRVVLAATIAGHTSTGVPWHLRLVNAHLDNTFNPRRLWLAAEHGRTRQARALLSLDDQEPLILGGDFNTWSGFIDRAYLTLARRFPDTQVTDRRATFRGLLRLDHLFFRLQPGWRAGFRRLDLRFGSDHFPLVGTVQFR